MCLRGVRVTSFSASTLVIKDIPIFLQDAALQLRFSPTEEDEPSIYDMRPAPPPQGNKLDEMGGWSSPPNHDSHLPHISSMADLPDMCVIFVFIIFVLIFCTCQKVIICNTHVQKILLQLS